MIQKLKPHTLTHTHTCKNLLYLNPYSLPVGNHLDYLNAQGFLYLNISKSNYVFLLSPVSYRR